jgi:predicted Zn-dependent peptidase
MGLMSGPLFALLRDRMAVAYSLGFGASAMRIAGYVKASAAVKPGAEDAAIEGIRGELARVLDGGEGAADLLRRGAAHLAGTQEMAFQKKGAVAHWMCTNDLTPLGYDSFCTVADRIRATDPSEAIDAARRALAGEAVVVVLKPEDGPKS